MSLIRKRKLNDRQKRRLQKQRAQSQHIDDDALAEGMVVSHFGKQLEVKLTQLPKQLPQKPPTTPDEPDPFWLEPVLSDVWRCHVRTNLELVTVGDRVRLTLEPNTGLGVVEAVHPRSSVIKRPDRYHKVKPVAANVDVMLIVFAAIPAASPELIDRYLVVAKHSGVRPVLVLNKADLLAPNAAELDLLSDYASLGIDTLTTSMYADLTPLKNIIQGKAVVFLGQSGVGKSSLINALEPAALQKIKAISKLSELGQHTTTASRMIDFLGDGIAGGAIIDSPGVREYGLWHLEPDDILAGFTDIAQYAGDCKFRNCTHTGEPNCAVKAAVANGDISQKRLASYLSLQKEVTQN